MTANVTASVNVTIPEIPSISSIITWASGGILINSQMSGVNGDVFTITYKSDATTTNRVINYMFFI